jgi:hypothetical protein
MTEITILDVLVFAALLSIGVFVMAWSLGYKKGKKKGYKKRDREIPKKSYKVMFIEPRRYYEYLNDGTMLTLDQYPKHLIPLEGEVGLVYGNTRLILKNNGGEHAERQSGDCHSES